MSESGTIGVGLQGVLQKVDALTGDQVGYLVAQRHDSDAGITQTVVLEGLLKEDEYLQALGAVLNLPYERLGDETIEKACLDRIPTKAVFQYDVIPVRDEDGVLVVAVNDPFVPGLTDALRLASGGRVRLVLSPGRDIAEAAKKFYGVGADTLERMIADDDRIDVDEADLLAKTDISDLDQDASIVKFVNQVIWEAYQERATDIHLEPMEEELRVRYRVDGRLNETPLPAQLVRFQAAIISRIKVMSNMDIAEKRLPQDGRIGLRMNGEDLDVRVSTMPTTYGESVSLRLLMRGGEMINLSDLGMIRKDMDTITALIHRPNGIILVTGPTGSGKSTSLYAYLGEINSVDIRILTVEDPIEYEMTGVNQISVRSDIGLTFSTALRHILRQDPDVIMIGEIRDFETAEIAIRASLTGHLVFSTLHTNDAAGAVTRLIDMGVEPFLVASSVKAVVAQRLVRKVCADCRRAYAPDMNFLQGLDFPLHRLLSEKMYETVGCEVCRQTGFRGRIGLYEVLPITEQVETLIVSRSASSDIKAVAVSQGMRTLRQDGWDKMFAGMTTLEEVLRASEESEQGS